MPQIIDIVQNNGIQLTNDIRANMGQAGMNATLKTANSLRIETRQEGSKVKMTLFGRPFFMTVQTGRRPTPDKKPSRDMISNITEWVEARGLDEKAVWAIATNIQKKGTKLWQEGGRTDIVDPAVDDFVNQTATDLLDLASENLILKIREMKW
jgi:hypothetical protein